MDSNNCDKYYLERKHNQRFLGVFLMFGVISVAIAFILVFSMINTQKISGDLENAGAGPAASATCFDSDGGKDYFVKGTCYENNVTKGTDSCYGNSTCLEYYCNTKNKCTAINMSCLNVNGSNGICANGACQKTAQQPVYNCTDSDGGIKPYIKGTVSANGKIYNDICRENGTMNVTSANGVEMIVADSHSLNEFYCNEGFAAKVLIYCVNGCNEGKCIDLGNMTNETFFDYSDTPEAELDGPGGGSGGCKCPAQPREILYNGCASCGVPEDCHWYTCTVSSITQPYPHDVNCFFGENNIMY